MLKKTNINKIKDFILSIVKSNYKEIINFILSKFNKKYWTNLEIIIKWDLTQESDMKQSDYVLSQWDIVNLSGNNNKDIYIFDQGQEWRTRYWCVVINWYLMVCNNTNHKPSYDEIHDWLNYFENKWLRDQNAWASIPVINDEWRKRWNELYPNNQIKYYRTESNWILANELLKRGYEVQWGRSTFTDYSVDARDGQINKSNYIGWKRKSGHSLNIMLWNFLKASNFIEIIKGWSRDKEYTIYSNDIHCVNSYASRDYNVYEHKYFKEHVNNGIWYGWLYCVVPLNEWKENPDTAGKPKEESIFLNGSKFSHIIIDEMSDQEELIFNDFKDSRPATIWDVKELIQIFYNRKK